MRDFLVEVVLAIYIIVFAVPLAAAGIIVAALGLVSGVLSRCHGVASDLLLSAMAVYLLPVQRYADGQEEEEGE